MGVAIIYCHQDMKKSGLCSLDNGLVLSLVFSKHKEASS
jgi:hypothetical protein